MVYRFGPFGYCVVTTATRKAENEKTEASVVYGSEAYRHHHVVRMLEFPTKREEVAVRNENMGPVHQRVRRLPKQTERNKTSRRVRSPIPGYAKSPSKRQRSTDSTYLASASAIRNGRSHRIYDGTIDGPSMRSK